MSTGSRPSLPGVYEVSAVLQGFVTAKVPDVSVELGKQLPVELTMKLAGVAESVTVTAESPLIDTKASATTASLDAAQIDLIPKGRGLLSVLTQIPGTNNESRGGGLMIDGASGSENRFLVDGVDRTNARTGSSNAITGTEVVTAGLHRDRPGQAVRLQRGIPRGPRRRRQRRHQERQQLVPRNRPGRTTRPTAGSARSARRCARCRATRRGPNTSTIPRDEGHQTDIVLSLGGPILKDKGWFFVGYAPQFYPTERTVRWANPGTFPATQTFDTDGNNKVINYNATSQLTSTVKVRFTGSNETQQGALRLPDIQPDGTSTASAATFNPRSQVFTEQFQNAYSGIMDWNATKSTFVNTTVSYLGYGQHSAGGDYFHGTRRTFSTPNIGHGRRPGQPPAAVRVRRQQRRIRSRCRTTISASTSPLDATKYGNWKGEHALKIGGLYERIGNQANLGDQHPNIALNWGSVYGSPSGFERTGPFGYFEVRRIFTGGDIKETNLSFFAQDQWTVNNKLTVNYGLRLENEEIPSYNPNAPGVKFGWGDKIAPRAGFAYDLKGDGKTKLYGSYGVFYDTMKLEMPRGAWGGEKWISYYYTLDTPNWPSIDCSDGFGATCTGGTFIESINFRHTSNEPGSTIGQVDPNLKPTQKHEYTLGLDRELRARMSLGIRYAHKGWDETIDDIGVCEPGSQVCGEVYNIANPGKGIGQTPIVGPQRQDGAEGRQRLRRRRARGAQALLEQLAGHLEHPVQPSLRQLRRPRQLGRKRPPVAERQPLLRRAVPVVRPEGQRSDRPPEHRSSGAVQTPGHLHPAVGHQHRRATSSRRAGCCSRRP